MKGYKTMKKTYRCYVNMKGFDKTLNGKRKIWRTDKVITYAASLTPVYFVWERSTKHNNYNAYNAYIEPKYIEFID